MHVDVVCLLAFAGCGGGERQDENEPEGNFPVEVVPHPRTGAPLVLPVR